MKFIAFAAVLALSLALTASRVSAGSPDNGTSPIATPASDNGDAGSVSNPDMSNESAPSPDQDAGSVPASDDTQNPASPDQSQNTAVPTDDSASSSPAASPASEAAAAATPQPTVIVEVVSPPLGGQCIGAGTYYVSSFGCTPGSLPAMPAANNPNGGGSCGGNAAPTIFGCTAGYLGTAGSVNSPNTNGSNGCPGIQHRTALGCTSGLP